MTGYWDAIDIGDQRIADGFGRMRARRDEQLAAGAAHAGWKVGMNDGGIREMLGIGSGVVGYLTSRTRTSGEVVPGTGRLGAEVEVLFEIGASGELARAAAAIEIVDLHELEITDALARDVWHHGFASGPFVPWEPSLLGALRVELRHNGESIPVAPPGDDRLRDLDGMRAFAASGASIVGPGLHPGDVVLSGSLAPSIVWLQPGDVIEATIEPLGSVSVRVAV
jgi:2-keto-4-pentenoate hydratase